MFRKFFEAEEGFTLIELLVTIAIMAVLFGIVTLTLSGVGDNATDSIIIAECAIVQSAADIYLAADTSRTITAETTARAVADTDNFGAEYIRDLPTSYTYTWDASGEVTCEDLP